MPSQDRYITVADAPRERPLILYDGACTFCQMSVLRIAAWTGPRVDFATSDSQRLRFPEIPRENFDAAVQYVDRDGAVSAGAAAVLRAMTAVPVVGSFPIKFYKEIPVLAAVLEFLYGIVARNRKLVSKWVLWTVGSDVRPARYTIAGDLFPRLMGLVYLCALLSLFVQWDGLYGARGILPVQEYLNLIAEQFPDEKYSLALTAFWWRSDAAFVNALFAVGIFAAVLAMLGLLPLPALSVCWAVYLSICSVGQDFMSFQWDYLLLEAGLLAIFWTPWVLRFSRSRSPEPPRLARWAVWFLLFKLMLLSGAVKLFGGDENWRNGSALQYHFLTQPLPSSVSYYAHQLPGWMLTFFCYATLLIETFVPFFIFMPRCLRRWAFVLFVLLQFMIALTGNYGFFNLLTFALCIALLDDGAFPAYIRETYHIVNPLMQPPAEVPSCVNGCALPNVRVPRVESVWQVRPSARRWPPYIIAPVLVPVLFLSAFALLIRLDHPLGNTAVVQSAMELVRPLRSINSYGLFQTMTTVRDEVVIEGSSDGRTWLPYELKYKPGEPGRRPPVVGPHMPRLDWQMWFAALGTWRQNPWFTQVLKKIFEGSPDVLAQFERNPFPNQPPRHLRARLYEYTFTTVKSKRSDWWERKEKGLYFPAVTRRDPATP